MLQEVVDMYLSSLAGRASGHSGQRGPRVRGGSSQNTMMAYRNDLSQICGYLTEQGLTDWSQVTREDIANYLLRMRDGYAYRSTTIARKVAALKAFFRFLLAIGAITQNPIEKLDTPPVQKELPQVLNAEQILNLFQQVKDETPGGLRDLAMLHILYATGMRASELVALNVEDVDLERAQLQCAVRGGPVKRALPLSAQTVEVLRQYLERGRFRFARRVEEAGLFLNYHGERLTRQGFWLIIKGYARRAGIAEITPNMLRHSFATLMLKEGMDLRSVQELLGHAHISTTQIYSQLVRFQLEEE